MNEAIEEFYRQNHIPIGKMISIGVSKMNLTSAAIKEAAKQVYDDIQSGIQIRPIRYAWEVYARAKHLRTEAEAKENERIAALEKELAYYKQPFWKRLRRYSG